MQKFLFFLLLVNCSQEYNITDRKTTPSVDVSVYTADTGRPPLVVDIPETGDTGEELVPLIHVSPYDYDFGEVQINCSESYDVTISSVGTAPLIIEDFYYINSPDLSMTFNHKLPFVLEPGEETIISFEYNEDDLFEDNGKLYIYSNALGKAEQRVDHYGQGVSAGSQVDVFEFEQINKADILFVVDNSCSMSEEQTDLSDNAEDFVDTLVGSGTDFQISVITTDSPDPVTSIITEGAYDAGKALADAVVVGTSGSPTEKGQEMSLEALRPSGPLGRGFVREDATLSIVIISDEDDYSPLTELEYYDSFLGIKDEDLFFFHSVVGLAAIPGCSVEVGDRYLTQSWYTGGTVLDICGAWGSSLTTLANPVYLVGTTYPLTKQAIPSTVKIFIGGLEILDNWEYDETTNSIIFSDVSTISGDEPLQVLYDYVEECN